MNEMITTQEALDYLGCHRSTLYRYVRHGWLRKYRSSLRDNCYSLDEVMRFKAAMLSDNLDTTGV